MKPYRELKVEKMSLENQSKEYWNYFKTRENSIIMDVFCGQLINQMECLLCRRKSTVFDTFLDLSLSVKLGRSEIQLEDVMLDDCLQDFVKPEKMEQSGYKCEGCKKESSISKSLSIFKFPKILVLHLKRFSTQSVRREKLNTRVNISEIIDLRNCAPLVPPNNLALS
mmetsp:Transcript_29793/g.28962  ORF Transcript_29793/g.28962 Transcript_29793/m.28962 type:complete len:168 (-) Transcript_29793:200-703(-)|eukprot:CAMPEP_0170549662 /NCGR_PEP_ID=MMETSP0211-20121228/7816_1 /TAXON_ID=311385 /ORGANISM="Pseudokeronopsis sp., Strain OXSARD2" /LENGTH=167 /DNA_ID=CAMNT_0010855809 /DNA_START=847 /DNA_END=1350 /DNA_ORIENTATION=+